MTDKHEKPYEERFVMQGGIHMGTPITRVPLSYLKWMVNVGHTDVHYAKAEMARRGTPTPQLDVSLHSIDKASLRAHKIWKADRKPNEGIASWLSRVALEARISGISKGDGVFWHMGMVFTFQLDDAVQWPVLKTIWLADAKAKRKRKRAAELLDDEEEI